MEKRAIGKKENFKKIIAGAALAAFLFSPKFAYASPNSQQKEKQKASISIILGAGKGFGNGLYAGEFGIKYNRFALVGNLGFGPDINLKETEEKLFRDVYFRGREDFKERSSSGAALEYHQPFSKGVSGVIGIGGNLGKHTRNIEEKLIRKTVDGEETELASKTTDVPEKKSGLDIYGGFSFGKKLKINPVIGYKSGLEKGFYGGVRAIFSFSGKGGK